MEVLVSSHHVWRDSLSTAQTIQAKNNGYLEMFEKFQLKTDLITFYF